MEDHHQKKRCDTWMAVAVGIPCPHLKKEEMVVTTVDGEEAHLLTITVVTWGLVQDRDREATGIDQMMTTAAEVHQALTSKPIPTIHQAHSTHSRDRRVVVGIKKVEAEVVSVEEDIEAEVEEEVSTTTTDCQIFFVY